MSSKIAARLTGRDKRAVVVGAGAIVGLLLFLRGVPAWTSWRENARASAGEVRLEAHRTDRVFSDLPPSLDSLEVRAARLTELGSGFILGDTQAAAGGRLTSLLNEFGRISSVQLGPLQATVDTSDSSVAPRVIVGGTGSTDVAGLSSFLALIEGGPSVLTIRHIQVRAVNPTSSPSEREVLELQFEVEGLAFLRPVAKGDVDGPS